MSLPEWPFPLEIGTLCLVASLRDTVSGTDNGSDSNLWAIQSWGVPGKWFERLSGGLGGLWRFVFNSLAWFWTKISPVQVLFSGDDWGCAGDPISWIACRSNRFKVEMPDLIEIPDCKLLSILALPGDWPRKDSCSQTFDLCWVLFSGNLEVEKNHLYSWQPRRAGHRQLPWFCHASRPIEM